MSPVPMTIPLWGLVIFIFWAIAVVALLLTVRIKHLSAGGSAKDFGISDENSILWRLYRVQANLVENLPLYIGVLFLLTTRGKAGFTVDFLAAVYIATRLIHSLIHIATKNANYRLISLVIQLVCLVSLTTLAIF